MDEFVKIARKVIGVVTRDLAFEIVLTDENGYIVGANDTKRIGTFNPISKQIFKDKHYIIFDEADITKFKNLSPGVAAPFNFHHNTIGVLGIIGPPNEVRPHAKFIKRYVELIWKETYFQQIRNLEHKINEVYLQYILFSEKVEKENFIQYAETLDLYIDSKYLCIIIDLEKYIKENLDENTQSIANNSMKGNFISVISNEYGNEKLNYCSFINNNTIVLLRCIPSTNDYFIFMEKFKQRSKNIIKKLKKHGIKNVHIAAGSLVKTIFKIRLSYKDANILLQNNITKKDAILSYYDWDILTDISSINLNPRFKENTIFHLKNLTSDDNFIELKKSFITFCESGMNISEAAKRLYIHRNTLIYRLQKIEETLTMQTRNFKHCMLLYLILKNT